MALPIKGDAMQNKIQFQPGLSLTQFIEQYSTDEQCQTALYKHRWPEGFRCPKCGSSEHCAYNRKKLKVFQCSACRTQTTLTEGTLFHATKLPLTKWFQAIYLLTQTKSNVSGLQFKRHLGVCYHTAWLLKQKIMEVMTDREKSTVLSGSVEIDDSYLGGEKAGGKVGRGSENKIPFIAAIQKNKFGHPVYAVFSQVKAFTLEEVKAWAQHSLAPGTVVTSDGLACFNAVKTAGCIHDKVVVGKKQKSTDLDCFRWVNTILGNLKTAAGTYHAFDFLKYGYRYLGEYQYRFNRRFDLADMFTRLCSAAAKSGKKTENWLRSASAELCC